MAYNRYRGGGGRPERIPEAEADRPSSPLPPPEPASREPDHPAGRASAAGQGAGSAGLGPGGRRPEPPRPVFSGGHRAENGKTPPGALHGIRSSLDGILSRLDPGRLETEDLLVLAILWLLYRDSGDRELLIAMGAYLFL